MSYSLQRKSNRAKEKKQRRLEERAAMDAVCAKVVAANKVQQNIYILNLFKPLYVVFFGFFSFFFVILIVISFVQLEDPLSAFPVFKKYDRNGYVMSLFHKKVLSLRNC